MKLIFVLAFNLSTFLLSAQRAQTAFVIPEKDLVPEGITYDNQSKSFFVSSIFKNKIVRVTVDKRVSDFTSSKQDGIGQVLGIKAVNGKLWACSNMVTEQNERSMIHQYDIASGKLIRKWMLNFTNAAHLFNDLVVQNEVAYISDSNDGSVYLTNPQFEMPQLLVKDNKLRDINGIALLNEQTLVVNASTGFFRIDIQTKEIKPLPFEGYFPLGIDGLCKYNQSLVGIQNVVFPISINRYFLNASMDQIESAKVLLANHPQFDTPTTGVIVDNWFYFIANSQMLNVNGEQIKDRSKLKDVTVMKIRLD
jgi:hypothetical protein